MFGAKRDGVMRGFRKLHNEKLCGLYCLQNINRINRSKMMKWFGHVAQMEEKASAYRLLRGKAEEKRPLGRPRHRWVENIKMDI
jgi:hypothetical protein